MKQIKKNVLALSCVLAVALAGGISAMNTTPASADGVTTFQMIPGASVRAGGVNDNKNGIKFAAEISTSEFEALSDVSAGIFILPYSYVENYEEVNADTCFGAEFKYTWQTGEDAWSNGEPRTVATDTSKPVSILHVAATPFEAASEITDGETVYRVQGSVVDMQEENLDKKYVGVAYIKAGEDYYFTETKAENSRAIVTVAQNILNDADAAEKDVTAAEGYLTEYLGNGKEITVNQEVYVNSSTGYTKLTNVPAGTLETIENVVLSSANDFASLKTEIAPETAPAMTGYALATGNGVAKALPKVDENEVTLQYYFDRIVENTVIFDGDMSNVTLENQLDHAPTALTESSDWSYHGEKSILVDDYFTANAMIKFNQTIVLPAATNTLSFMVKNTDMAATTDCLNTLWIYEGNGKWITATFNTTGVPNEVYQITLTLSREISDILQIEVNTDHAIPGENNGKKGEKNPFYIDYIQAEYDVLGVEGKDVVIATEADEEVTVDVAGSFTSTVYSDAELAADLTATYTKLADGTATAQPATLTDGKFTLTVPEETNYQIDYTLEVGDVSLSGKCFALGYFKNMMTSFSDGGQSTNSDAVVTTTLGIDDNNALQIAASKTSWAYYKFTAVTVDTDVTTLCLWMYSATSGAIASKHGGVYLYNGNDYQHVSGFAGMVLSAGWNYVEINIGSLTKNPLNQFCVYSGDGNGACAYTYDRVSFR